MTGARPRVLQVYALLILLPYVSLHGTIDLVDVDWYLRSDVAWVVRLVGFDVADALHVLDID